MEADFLRSLAETRRMEAGFGRAMRAALGAPGADGGAPPPQTAAGHALGTCQRTAALAGRAGALAAGLADARRRFAALQQGCRVRAAPRLLPGQRRAAARPGVTRAPRARRRTACARTRCCASAAQTRRPPRARARWSPAWRPRRRAPRPTARRCAARSPTCSTACRCGGAPRARCALARSVPPRAPGAPVLRTGCRCACQPRRCVRMQARAERAALQTPPQRATSLQLYSAVNAQAAVARAQARHARPLRPAVGSAAVWPVSTRRVRCWAVACPASRARACPSGPAAQVARLEGLRERMEAMGLAGGGDDGDEAGLPLRTGALPVEPATRRARRRRIPPALPCCNGCAARRAAVRLRFSCLDWSTCPLLAAAGAPCGPHRLGQAAARAQARARLALDAQKPRHGAAPGVAGSARSGGARQRQRAERVDVGRRAALAQPRAIQGAPRDRCAVASTSVTSVLAGRFAALRRPHPAGRAQLPPSTSWLTPVAAAARHRSAAGCGSRARRARPRPPSRPARPRSSARRPSSSTRRASTWRRRRRRRPGRRAARSGAARRPATRKLRRPLAQRLRRQHGPPQVRLAAASTSLRQETALRQADSAAVACCPRRNRLAAQAPLATCGAAQRRPRPPPRPPCRSGRTWTTARTRPPRPRPWRRPRAALRCGPERLPPHAGLRAPRNPVG